MADVNRQVAFDNEKFALGMLRVVSGWGGRRKRKLHVIGV